MPAMIDSQVNPGIGGNTIGVEPEIALDEVTWVVEGVPMNVVVVTALEVLTTVVDCATAVVELVEVCVASLLEDIV